ncbi:MAG: hypothetical protein F6K31_28290 [Symploca sp. SIO2G7]|nr:hypothetical protein [Symploca sp. SIO2G7]
MVGGKRGLSRWAKFCVGFQFTASPRLRVSVSPRLEPLPTRFPTLSSNAESSSQNVNQI